MADADIQVQTCFNELFENVDETLINEVCFDHVKDRVMHPITSEGVYLNKSSLGNDNEWIAELNKKLILGVKAM